MRNITNGIHNLGKKPYDREFDIRFNLLELEQLRIFIQDNKTEAIAQSLEELDKCIKTIVDNVLRH